MADIQKPTDRLDYQGKLNSLVNEISESYGIGHVEEFSVVEVGYEDCNLIIKTSQGKFLAKMFSKLRKPQDIDRYIDIMRKVVEAGVNHPHLLHTTDGGSPNLYVNNVSLVLMRFIEGKTFLELDRAPNASERQALLEQAAKLNTVNYRPPYLFDSWAIPNIRSMFERVKHYIDSVDLGIVEQVMAGYEAIPTKNLPHAFVHGDLTKANVIKGDDDNIYLLDLSVANWYPRIQELAVIAANLMHDNNEGVSLEQKCSRIADEYSNLNELTGEERRHLYAYALAGVAMEFMGAHQEKFINGHDTEETAYWFKLGREGLREAFK